MYLSLLASPAFDMFSLTVRATLRRDAGDAAGEVTFAPSASRLSSASPATRTLIWVAIQLTYGHLGANIRQVLGQLQYYA